MVFVKNKHLVITSEGRVPVSHAAIDDGWRAMLTWDFDLPVFAVDDLGFDDAYAADDGFVIVFTFFKGFKEWA